MKLKPFLKWAGGKRWLVDHPDFALPVFSGRYIEPFLGGGAVFFRICPSNALLSDINPRLIETYLIVRDSHEELVDQLSSHQMNHSNEYYYRIRASRYNSPVERAAQFIYLNRTCWNGLYRVNRQGFFNVPIGTKNTVLVEESEFDEASKALNKVSIVCRDFEETISEAGDGDLLFVDPPYTTAHNKNGFVKYNENIFSWDDQKRLRISLEGAANRGALIILTNAEHQSIAALYDGFAEATSIKRQSVISGKRVARRETSEALYFIGGSS